MRVPGSANNGTYRETSLRAVQIIPVLVGSAVEVRQTGETIRKQFHDDAMDYRLLSTLCSESALSRSYCLWNEHNQRGVFNLVGTKTSPIRSSCVVQRHPSPTPWCSTVGGRLFRVLLYCSNCLRPREQLTV